MVETRGLVAAIEAADAMVKASDVHIVSVEQTQAALITIHVTGDVAAVQSAVDAGSRAAEKVGTLVSAHVIPKPSRLMLGSVFGVDAGGTSPETQPSESRAPRSIQDMTVRELRALARTTEGFPLQGRMIAGANKQQLLDAFRSLER